MNAVAEENESRRTDALYHRPSSWSYSLREVVSATVLPQLTYATVDYNAPDEEINSAFVYDGGVYDERGHIALDAIHVGGDHRNVPAPWRKPETVRRLDGTWLYGGLLRGHIGHFFVESLARLWGARSGGFAGTVFVNYNGPPRAHGVFSPALVEHRARYAMARRFIPETLQLLRAPEPYVVVGQPVHVERLVVPSQLLGNVWLPEMIAGHQVLHDWFRSGVDQACTDAPRTEKVYVSRSRLGLGKSSFMLEDELERILAADGYRVVYPETMTILDQIQAYRGASKIIIATGSAVHVLALALDGSQDVALLLRGGSTIDKFESQLRGFGARSLTTISANDGLFWPTNEDWAASRRFSEQAAIHTVDFDHLLSQLSAAGFVHGAGNFGLDMSVRRERTVATLRALTEHFSGAEFEWRPEAPAAYRDTIQRKKVAEMKRRALLAAPSGTPG